MGMQDTLRALADPTRREILNLLKKSRLSAGEIGDHFSISGAAVSRHLSVLKEADLIRDEREGKFIYYELNTTVLEEIMLWITELKGGNDHDQTTLKNDITHIDCDAAPDPYRIAFVEAASGFRCNPLEHRQRTGRLLIQGFCSVRASGDHADLASGMRDRNEH